MRCSSGGATESMVCAAQCRQMNSQSMYSLTYIHTSSPALKWLSERANGPRRAVQADEQAKLSHMHSHTYTHALTRLLLFECILTAMTVVVFQEMD